MTRSAGPAREPQGNGLPLIAIPGIKLEPGPLDLAPSLVRSSCELAGFIYLGSERFRKRLGIFPSKVPSEQACLG